MRKLISIICFIMISNVGADSGGVDSLRGDTQLSSLSVIPDTVDWVDLDDDKTIEKTFEEQPPLIPHEIEWFKTSLKSNRCMRCHSKERHEKAQATEIGESHYIDRAGKTHDKLVSSRYFCTQCHVPQTDAKPLIENSF